MEKPTIGVVLRAYNNPRIADQIKALADTGMIDKVVVVTHLLQDKNGFTQNLVAETLAVLPEEKRPQIKVSALSNYSWSNALNDGVSTLLSGDKPVDRVLCLSNEVDFKGRLGLEALLEASSQPHASCGYTLYDDPRTNDQPTYQVPRNTCTMWKSSMLQKYHAEAGHYFDPATDKTGGMEDVLTAMRLFARVYSLNQICKPIVSAIRAGIALPDGEKFAAKMAAENTSMDFIRSQFPKDLVATFDTALAEQRKQEAFVGPARPAVALAAARAAHNLTH